MRRRAFWIALPIAIAFALWFGPGLATIEDERPVDAPADPRLAPHARDVAPSEAPECEASHDPGPDGDR